MFDIDANVWRCDARDPDCPKTVAWTLEGSDLTAAGWTVVSPPPGYFDLLHFCPNHAYLADRILNT